MSVELIFELAWKSVLLAGLILLILPLMKRRSAAERSCFAQIGLLMTLLLPVTVIAGPDWQVSAIKPVKSLASTPAETEAAAPKFQEVGNQAVTARPALDAASAVEIEDVLPWVYGIPAAVLSLLLILAVLRLQLLRGRAEVLVEPQWSTALAAAQRRMGFKHGTALLVSEELRSPISWGVVRPIILLDTRAAEDAAQAEAIIAHELAHVARLDWAMLILGRLATSIFWFNPLVWLLARRCHELSEQAVDDTVLRSNIRSTDYAELLIKAASHDNRAILLAANGVAGSGPLTQRVERVLEASHCRTPAKWSWIGGCCAAALLISAPLSALSPLDQPSHANSPLPSSTNFSAAARTRLQAHPAPAADAVGTVVAKGAPNPNLTSNTSGPPHVSVLEEALVTAVAKGDRQSMNSILASGVSVNASVTGDGSPLIAAAKLGRVDLVRALLARGADIDMGVIGDGNPLIASAAAGRTEVVRLLLDRRADIEAVVPRDENALMQAAYFGHEDVVRLLVERGANVNSRVGVRTPLGRARDGRHPRIEKLLQEAGAKQ